MNDTFIARLFECKVLPGDTSNQLKTLQTQTDRAAYILYNVIEPALCRGDTSSFNDLLFVMDRCGYGDVEKLAHKIKSDIDVASGIELSEVHNESDIELGIA